MEWWESKEMHKPRLKAGEWHAEKCSGIAYESQIVATAMGFDLILDSREPWGFVFRAT